MKQQSDFMQFRLLAFAFAIFVTSSIIIVISSACTQLTPLIGEESPPGYISGDIPADYRDRAPPFGPQDELALAAGSTLYTDNCAVCHGAGGRGDGPKADYLEPRPADFSAPPLLRAFREHPDYVFWWVSEGVPKSSMPAWRDTLSETERWQVIVYARALGENTFAQTPDAHASDGQARDRATIQLASPDRGRESYKPEGYP